MSKNIIIIGNGGCSKQIIEEIERLSKLTGVSVLEIEEHIKNLRHNMSIANMSLDDLPKIGESICFHEKHSIPLENQPSKFFSKPKNNYRK